MARRSIIEFGFAPDDSGKVYVPRLDSELASMANAKKNLACVIEAPAGADIGVYGHFHVPAEYSSTPKIRVTGILDGAPGESVVLAFGFQHNFLADNETVDTAYETAELWQQTIGSNGGNYSDEDVVIMLSDALTGTIAAGDWVPYWFFRDDSADDYAGKFLLTGLEFDFTAS